MYTASVLKTNRSILLRLYDQSTLFFQEEAFSRVIKNTSFLLGGRAISAILGIATLAVTARNLGPGLFGLLVLIQTYVLVVDGLFNFQSWQALVRFGADKTNEGRSREFTGLIKVGFILDLLSAVAATALAFFAAQIFSDLIGKGDFVGSMTMAYSLVIISNLTGTPTAILKIFDAFSLLSFAKTMTALLRFTAVLLAVYLGGGGFTLVILAYITAEIMGNILLFGLGLAVFYRKGYRLSDKFQCLEWKEVVNFAFWTNIVSTVDLPVKQLDIFMVASIVSVEGVGVYRIIKSVSRIFVEVASPVFMTLYPESARHIAAGDLGKSMRLVFKTNGLMAFLFIPTALLAGLTSDWWVALFFGKGYLGSYTALLLYLLFSAFSASNMALHPHFLAQGYVKMNFSIVAAANVVYLAVLYFLGNLLGLVGVALAYAVQMTLVLLPKYLICVSDFSKRSLSNG